MRFVIVNLFIICLLLFGIGYLAFGDVETISKPVIDTCMPFQRLTKTACLAIQLFE